MLSKRRWRCEGERGRYRKRQMALAMVSCLPALAAAANANADFILKVRPRKCVVLEQGQTCHVAVDVTWSAGVAGDYCLHSSTGDSPRRCWTNTREGAFRESVASSSAVEYFMVDKLGDDRVVGTAILNVAWVYKSSGRPIRQWRLF